MKRIIIICLLASGVIFGQSIPTSHGRYVSGTLSPGQLITFSGSLSHDNDIINELCTPRYEWDFIFNGTFSANISTTSATVNYTYPNAGLFTVAMKYYDNDCQAGNIYTFTIEIVGLTRYYYIKDQLGSVRITMNQQGNVVSGQDYYPYGEICRSLNNADPNDKYKFTEKERDVETNFDYFGARYFDSQISRWLSVDPMADLRPGLSPYNYCQNNPLRRIDPTGMLDQASPGSRSHAYPGVGISGIDYYYYLLTENDNGKDPDANLAGEGDKQKGNGDGDKKNNITNNDENKTPNVTKLAVSVTWRVRAAMQWISGFASAIEAVAFSETGFALYGLSLKASFNFTMGLRANQTADYLWDQGWEESMDDASWKNLNGIFPAGYKFDDKNEPGLYWMDQRTPPEMIKDFKMDFQLDVLTFYF